MPARRRGAGADHRHVGHQEADGAGPAAQRGHRTVDTDDEGWSQQVPSGDGPGLEQLWCEDRTAALLAQEPVGPLFVAGCVRQGRADRFDAVVLLSVPVEVVLERLASRGTNGFGNAPAERERVLQDLAAVEPLLRARATAELDTRRPLAEVVDAVEELARRPLSP